MDENDRLLIKDLEQGLPLQPRPFKALGKRIGLSEQEVISRILNLKDEGILRRMRARINQRSLGIVANALVGWNCGILDPDQAGELLANMPGVTHCYRRKTVPGRWEYTHYTVHHGWSYDQVQREIEMIVEKTGLSNYIVLFSTEEYKRIPHVRIDLQKVER